MQHRKKKPLHLIHRPVNMEHLFKSVFSDIVFHLIFSAILKSGLCTVCTLLISLARAFWNTRKEAEYPRQFNTTWLRWRAPLTVPFSVSVALTVTAHHRRQPCPTGWCTTWASCLPMGLSSWNGPTTALLECCTLKWSAWTLVGVEWVSAQWVMVQAWKITILLLVDSVPPITFM